MAKDLNIHTTFEGKNHIFQCQQTEFFNAAANYYNIDIRNIEFYALGKGNRYRIAKHYEIFDVMKVELVRKKSVIENERNLRSCLESELTKKEALVQRITGKLRNNSVLTGEERKHLLNMLLDDSKNPGTKKRKHDGDSYGSKPKMFSKKVQVHPSAQFTRDSCTQTDIFEEENIQFQKSFDNTEEQTITAIKKMSCDDQKDNEKAKQLMKQTFDARRAFIIMENPLVVAIKDKYPLLFNVDEVKNELDRLFFQGKCEDFLENIDKYSSVILDLSEPSHEMFIKTMKCIKKAVTKDQKKYARNVGSILLLPILMKEELDFLTFVGKDCPKEVYPYIDASLHSLKDLFYDNILYRIIVEQRQLCEAIDFKEAILCLMASFFIFNIRYPENCMQTLIVFEKLYLCANDTADDLIDGDTQQMIKLLKFKANTK